MFMFECQQSGWARSNRQSIWVLVQESARYIESRMKMDVEINYDTVYDLI